MHDESDNPYASSASEVFESPSDLATEQERTLREPLRFFIVQAAVVLVLSALVLDMGRTFRVALIAVVAQLLAVLIVLRRNRSGNQTDRAVVRWGLLFFLAVAILFANLVAAR
jgi:hypothetical protein